MEKKFQTKLSLISLKKNNKTYTPFTSLAAVFPERFNFIIRDFLKRPVYERKDANCLYTLPRITKQNNNRKHSSTKLNPIEGSIKKNERYVCYHFFDRRRKIGPNFKLKDLFKSADFIKSSRRGCNY